MTDLSFVSIRQSKDEAQFIIVDTSIDPSKEILNRVASLSCINNFLENIEDIAVFLRSLEKYMKGH